MNNTTFKDKLNDLRNHVGSRNGRLVSIVVAGIGEGFTAEQIADAFENTDTGSPPLSPAEISRAITRGVEFATGDDKRNPVNVRRAVSRMRAMREATSPDERGFVRRMIATGYKAGRHALTAHSPVKTWMREKGMDFRREASLAFLHAVYPDGDAPIFATPKLTFARTRERMFTPRTLAAMLTGGIEPYQNCIRSFNPVRYFDGRNPENGYFICPVYTSTNYFTGTAAKISGRESYANAKTIARRINALIEFDLLPLEDQIMFWTGVVVSESLDVMTVTYSGGKSLHGIIRVREAQGDDLFGEVSDEAARQQWERNILSLYRLCCSDEDESYRCDAACKDATRTTRFPGGLRDGYRDQILLYAAQPQNSNW